MANLMEGKDTSLTAEIVSACSKKDSIASCGAGFNVDTSGLSDTAHVPHNSKLSDQSLASAIDRTGT